MPCGKCGEWPCDECEWPEETTERSPVDRGVIKPCPFKEVEKEMGHEPYTMEDELWHVQCTCGARGPISPTPDYAIKAWNKWAI